MMRFVNVRELKNRTSEILRAAAGEDIVVTNRGKPVAVVRKFDGSEFERAAFRPTGGRVRETGAFYGAIAEDLPPPESIRGPNSALNPLKAVFWDYPELTDADTLRRRIREAKDPPAPDAFRWYLTRFLERGRVVDTKKFFHLDEIREEMPRLRLTEYTRRKWIRLFEVYGHA
jgi:hypothetical protein